MAGRGITLAGIFVTVLTILLVKSTQAVQLDRIEYTSDSYHHRRNQTPAPFECYDCSSEFDPRCGDPFNPYSIGTVNCFAQKPPEHVDNPGLHPDERMKPTVCRKIIQKVEGKRRVIRECGYIQDDRDDKDCIRRTGTKDVEIFYCSCRSALCNRARSLGTSFLSLLILALSAAVSVLGMLIVRS